MFRHYTILHGPLTSRDIVVGTATHYGLDVVRSSKRGGGEIYFTRPERPCSSAILLSRA
jgi:hypothetical protein